MTMIMDGIQEGYLYEIDQPLEFCFSDADNAYSVWNQMDAFTCLHDEEPQLVEDGR